MSDLLSTQSLLALGFVGALVGAAFVAAHAFLPSTASVKARRIFIWLAFDALCHFTLEGSFLYYSTFGRTVNASRNFFAYLWQDYAKADARWGTADPTVVALEILTVLGAGPLAAYCALCIAKNRPSYHFWVVVLSVAELYGGFMTFCPEWLTGNKALNGSTFLLMWIYLFFMNMVWVAIPLKNGDGDRAPWNEEHFYEEVLSVAESSHDPTTKDLRADFSIFDASSAACGGDSSFESSSPLAPTTSQRGQKESDDHL